MSAALVEIVSFLDGNKKSKECPILWQPKFDSLTALTGKQLSNLDEKQVASFVEISFRNWPFSDSSRSPDVLTDTVDFYGKVSKTKDGDQSYICFRTMIFQVLMKWTCACDKMITLFGRMKLFDKFPGWLKQLMPQVDFAQPKKFIQDPELQMIAELTFCIMKMAKNALSNKTIGKHVFFLCASCLGALYKPDVTTDGSKEHVNDRFAEVFSSFYNEGLHFANEDLALKLMSNGTSAKLRELTMHGIKAACLATVTFDYTYMALYARGQGQEEQTLMANNEKQGIKLKEEANSLYKGNEVAKAYDYYKKSIEVWPYDAKTWGNLALCCQKLNRTKEGKEAAFACLQKDPKWWKSWCRVGDVLNKKKTSRLAYVAYTVAEYLQKSNEISERLSEFNKEQPIDLESEFSLTKPLEFFMQESHDKCALFIGYQVLKSDTKKVKSLEENVGETFMVSAATFGSKTKQFGIPEWIFNIYSSKERKPISIGSCVGKPNGNDLKHALLRAIFYPLNGKQYRPSVLLLAHRFAAYYTYLVETLGTFGIFVRLETKKEAELACAKFNTSASGDNSAAGEANLKTVQNVYHQTGEE